MNRVVEAKPPAPLSEVMNNLKELSRDIWLFIPVETQKISMNTVCRFVSTDDYLDEEIDQFTKDRKVKEFFYKDQLEDILEGIKNQKKKHSAEDLEKAINYYWNNDAFIEL